MGSEDAALAPNPVERIIDDAARPFERMVAKTYVNGTFKTPTLDGWSDSILGDKPSEALKTAISSAIPLPTTIQDAARECAAWETRDDERRLRRGWLREVRFPAFPGRFRGAGSTPARAACLPIRRPIGRYCIALEYPSPEIERGVLADLEQLARIIPGDPV